MTLALVAAVVLSQAAMPPAVLPETAPLQLERYLGTWYEVARFDTFFERDCVGVRATYSKRDDGDVKVVNVCHKGTLDAPEKAVEGKAWVPDAAEPGKLKVQFFWPFSGPYWVLEVAPDYSWALVGHPKKSSCWVFSRAANMDPALYEQLLGKLRARGYDTTKLMKTAQPI